MQAAVAGLFRMLFWGCERPCVRLALNEARRLKEGGLALLALPCNSFSIMRLVCSNLKPWNEKSTLASVYLRSRSTSGRNAITPEGNRGYGFVHVGNVLLGRICLLALFLSAFKVRWLLEQPATSCVDIHPWMDYLRERVHAMWLQSFRIQLGWGETLLDVLM